ncbi:MAG: hypothetical protein CTY22_00045 [Methylomonas sp.]|nr:MAG: hypothetical protein CTY23_01165 [Methylomonas sp.]PPD27839.1 MAG: hypothetical protein CTY22_00045 [Methylomonas sp.]PPD39948.1 MAG: hypothetical protein CTY21_00045 [Methylomonas sp.]PPD41073.1 MAG: hypothetical protein CTY17_04820 [Methylomonas sp.]PPD52059.1 MAG: hypothetical protein CTY11_10645 [Methylomonas sp.]
MLLIIGLSLGIGVLLGLLGGGGSILTVPMLVYLLGIEPKTAIVTSFVVVGTSSLAALIPHARRGFVCWRSGAFFGLSGMVGAFGGGRLASHFPGDALMVLFGLVCLATALLMLRARSAGSNDGNAQPFAICPLRVPYLRVLFDGFFVGALTGMVGVGGGFMIVPALTLLVGLPMQGAVGTSLLVIAMNALAGLAGYSHQAEFDALLTLAVTVSALAGSMMGSALSTRIQPARLRRLFGLMVLAVALYIVWQSFSLALLERLIAEFSDARAAYRVLFAIFLIWLLLRIGGWVHKTDRVDFDTGKPNAED